MTPCCPQPSLMSRSVRRLLGYVLPPATPLPGTPSTSVHSSVKKKASPLPLPPHWKEDVGPCPRLWASQAACARPKHNPPSPPPALGVTQRLDTKCCHQPLLLPSATERNSRRFKESRNSNDEVLRLFCKSLSGSSATCGAVGEDLCSVPGWSLTSLRGCAVFPKAVIFYTLSVANSTPR